MLSFSDIRLDLPLPQISANVSKYSKSSIRLLPPGRRLTPVHSSHNDKQYPDGKGEKWKKFYLGSSLVSSSLLLAPIVGRMNFKIAPRRTF
ncbi:uncharacterized protein FOMMEDRAFT_164593 [Fomitiporia mediterranea MF3/22]|uniref:uncharacterized protein n=1 Tax=Fomitiporia mediterranea (strain MF3/22) TaxID=694068 RepID=UPI000440863B|nr:uncharacterized protein FOMMEDRAFT_164593 [Fomitiporia mediterranea MF3/22]EJD07691.1 hypothetical protein FOMMEDRAFT_164593 [Fomitiporia mediterranea MF3/22]